MNSIMQVLSIIIIIYHSSWPAVFALVLMGGYVAVECDWGKLQKDNKQGALHSSLESMLCRTEHFRAGMLRVVFLSVQAHASMGYWSMLLDYLSVPMVHASGMLIMVVGLQATRWGLAGMANHENNCVCFVGGCEAPGLGQSVGRPGLQWELMISHSWLKDLLYMQRAWSCSKSQVVRTNASSLSLSLFAVLVVLHENLGFLHEGSRIPQI